MDGDKIPTFEAEIDEFFCIDRFIRNRKGTCLDSTAQSRRGTAAGLSDI